MSPVDIQPLVRLEGERPWDLQGPSMLQVGDIYEEEFVFDSNFVRDYAHLVGDLNPLHLDPLKAQASGFQDCIVHGMLVASVFSRVLGVNFPGPGTIYLNQNISFKAPVYVGERTLIRFRVLSQKQARPIFTISTELFGTDRTTPKVSGEALIKLS